MAKVGMAADIITVMSRLYQQGIKAQVRYT